MNYEAALKVIEKYRQDRLFTLQYQAALAYFASHPQTADRLDPFLRELISPGGMTCQECKELIPLVLAGIPLDPAKQAAFDAHLKECPDCQQEFVELQMMSQGF